MAATGAIRAEPVRLGMLRLTDAAPVAVAEARGLFAAAGLAVVVAVEPSWANIADKLAYGLLDAAVMLPPLALAMALGLRGRRTDVIVPLGLSRNGNAVTLAPNLIAPGLVAPDAAGTPALAAARGLAGRLHARARAGLRPPVLAVVHGWSTHDLLLRYWLAAGGIDPDRDTELTVVPPAAMVAALAEGRIDGFCAGAPWGAVAAERGLGRTAVLSSAIWRDHPEKCLAVRQAWAEADPPRLQALLRALLAAAVLCDDPAETPAIAALLAGPAYVDAPVAAIAASLPGGVPGAVDRSVFHARGAGVPRRSDALWFLHQMARWRGLPADLDPAAVAARVYRPDLHPDAAAVGPDTGIDGRDFCDGGTSP